MTIGLNPRLFADFNQLTLPDSLVRAGFVFTRASTAWRRKSDGYFHAAPVNLLTQSNVLSNSAWTKNLTTVTSGKPTYDGTSNAWLALETATTGAHNVQVGTAVVGVVYSAYTVAKAYVGTNTRYLQFAGAGLQSASEAPVFDLVNGTVSLPATRVVLKAASITSLGGGWYRCAITVLSNATTAIALTMQNSISFTAPSYLGNTNSGFYVYQTMLCEGYESFDYIDTTTTAIGQYVGDYNAVTSRYSGLVEPAQTNAVPYSSTDNAVWSKSNVTVTAGTSIFYGYSSMKCTATATSAAISQAVGTFSGSTESIYVIVEQGTGTKSHFGVWDNISAAYVFVAELDFTTGGLSLYATLPVGVATLYSIKISNSGPNGGVVYLCAATYSGTSGHARYITCFVPGVAQSSGYNYLHHVQQVNSSWWTSPIVTGGASRSRQIESLIGNTTNWFKNDGIVFYTNFTVCTPITSNSPFIEIGDGTNNYRCALAINGISSAYSYSISGGVSQASPSAAGSVAFNTPRKAACSLQAGTFITATDGVGTTINNSGIMPSGMNKIAIGSTTGGAAQSPVRFHSIAFQVNTAVQTSLTTMTT